MFYSGDTEIITKIVPLVGKKSYNEFPYNTIFSINTTPFSVFVEIFTIHYPFSILF